MSSQEDFLDKTSRFLAKREGIDKTLKILRYSAKLALALGPKDAELKKRLSSFEKSVGVSRKAYRLGKFIQDVNSLRHSKTCDATAWLELLAYGGEGVYYFAEQLTWLIKTGALSKDLEDQISPISSTFELLGYTGGVCLSLLKLQKLMQQEQQLEEAVLKLTKDGSADPKTEAKLAAVRFQRRMRIALIVQDLADSFTAINDLTGGRIKGLNSPLLLALAGLASGSISFYKYWTA